MVFGFFGFAVAVPSGKVRGWTIWSPPCCQSCRLKASEYASV